MSLLNIGFSGLNSAQIALNITAQNIANVNTIGYSRQEAMMGSLSGFGRLDNGQGVEVTGVRRITDDYLVSQHWRSRSATGASYSFHQYINTTEQLLGSESMNIAKGLDSFFASLSAALDSPETPAQRSQIVSSAGALANRFGQLNESMLTQEKQIDDQLNSTVSQVNSYLKQVAELNTQISEQASKGVNTSVLEDSREQIVRELSTFMEVRVNRQSDGSFSLSLPQGQPLVLAGSSSTLSLAGDKLSLSFGPQSFDIPKLHGGSLAGVMEYRTTVLRPLRDELNQIAKKLADDFNAKQGGGVDLHGNPGKPLFTYDPLNPSGTLKIADGFTGDDLAFAKAGGGSGDNRNLQDLLTIKDDQYDAYSALLGRMAVQSGQAKATMTADANMEKQLATKLSSVSGVNTDEEGVKIMAYTKAYQANAKVISTSEQLFTSILNISNGAIMRISTNQIQLSMLDNLQHGFGEYARLDRQISTNKRILQPSDDPVGSVRLLGLKKEQVAMEQYQKNIANAKSQLSQGEQQLETMTNMLMRLRELTQTAATGSLSEDDRRAVASETAVIKDGLLDLANARNESGSSLFAGSQVGKTAIVKTPTGDYQYQGDALIREVSIAKGVTVGLNQTADQLFIQNGDFFKQLDAVVDALENGAPDAADQARDMLGRSKTLQDDISQMVSTIGARINLLDQVDEGHAEKGTYSKEVSNQIESLDYASAVTQQAHVLMALQVQQQAFAKVNGLSLFNYMP